MTRESVSKRTYPWTTSVKDKPITIRLMKPEDSGALLAFARSLPEDDLLFLAVDITRPEALDQWVHDIKTGQIKTVLAESNGKLVGHGTLSHNALQWTRHLGAIVLLLSPNTVPGASVRPQMDSPFRAAISSCIPASQA